MFSTAKTYRILVFVEDTKSSAVWNLVWKAKASQKVSVSNDYVEESTINKL